MEAGDRAKNFIPCWAGSESPYSTLAQSLPFAEVHVRVRFLTAGWLPPLRGVCLRGGLGYHLKRTICHVRGGTCSDCVLRSNCVYTYLFEGVAPADREVMRLYPYVPQPFTIATTLCEPGEVRPGQSWEFGLRLFGPAIRHFPYAAYALMEVGKEGLGKDKAKFEIETIVQPGVVDPMYENGTNRIGRLEYRFPDLSTTSANNGKITLEFVTPVRLRVGGEEARVLKFSDIVRAANRRLSILTYFYGTPIRDVMDLGSLVDLAGGIRTVLDKTRWFQFSRYSGRQGAKMTLGGLVGRIGFAGDLRSFLPLLELVEITHVGKATSFGFGRIAISER